VLVVKHAVNGRDASLPLAAIAKTRSAVRHDRGGRNLAGIRLIAEIALRARQMETSGRLNPAGAGLPCQFNANIWLALMATFKCSRLTTKADLHLAWCAAVVAALFVVHVAD
jgi:hypothetical protein